MALRALALLFLLAVLAAMPAATCADDVPEEVRGFYRKAQVHFAEGDHKKAYSAISKGKAKNPLSVDFWELYVRIWRALDKKETTLWEKIIAKAEGKAPDSAVFLLLRARLETDPVKRIAHLKAATEKSPDTLGPWLLLARAYVAEGEDGEAEEILDSVLAKDPSNETALVAKGELMIESGFSRSAVEYAQEQLQQHDLPGLHALVARGLLLVAENDESVLAEAEAEARKAVEGRADPEYVLVLVDVLDHVGKDEEAVRLLGEHHAKTGSPLLAGRLGELAFRTGDYEKAVNGLTPALATDANVARALSAAHARCGRAAPARQATKALLQQDEEEEAKAWAAAVELLLGDFAAARRHLEGVESDEAQALTVVSHAWEGNVAEVAKLVGEDAKDGSRAGEEWLVQLGKARLFEKLGPKAEAARKMLLESRWSAAQSGVASAKVPESEPSVKATSFGFMHRYVTYRRSLDGHWFETGGFAPIAPIAIGETLHVATVVQGTSDCERDAERTFPFNAVSIGDAGESGEITISANDEAWQEATQAFQEGSAALVDGDWAKADEAFGRAHEKEEAWGRARLFQAVAKALSGTDTEGAASLAATASTELVDDWHGREAALLVRLLAGKDVSGEAKLLAERRESFALRRYDEF